MQFGPLFATLVALLGSAVPCDHLQFLRRLHPTESVVAGDILLEPGHTFREQGATFRRFDFTCDPKCVCAAFPMRITPLVRNGFKEVWPRDFTLPWGDQGCLWNEDAIYAKGKPAGRIRCSVFIKL